MATSEKKFNFNDSKAQHYWSETETAAYVNYINSQLAEDQDLQHLLPIPTNGTALFDRLKDGVLLAKLVNNSNPDTINVSKLNLKAKNPIHMGENLRKVLDGAVKIGVRVHNVGPDDIIKGTPHLCLGLIWQIIKLGLLRTFAASNSAPASASASMDNIAARANEASISGHEKALLAWMNSAISAAGYPNRVSNFTSDLADSVALAYLLQFVDQEGTQVDAAQLIQSESDLTARAELVLQAAQRINCRQFASASGIVSGNKNLNLAFIAVLHNATIGKVAANRLNQQQANTNRANNANNANDQKLAQLQQQLNDALEDSERFKRERDESRKLLRDARTSLEESQQNSNNANQRVRDAEQAASSLQEQLANARKEKEAAQKRRDEALESMQHAEQQNQSLVVKFAASSEQLRLAEQRIADLQSRTESDIQEQNRNLSKVREDTARKYQELESQFEATLQETNNLQRELNNTRKRLEEKVQNLSNESNEAREQLRAAENARQELQQQNNNLQSERDEASRKIYEVQQRLELSIKERENLQQDLANSSSRSQEKTQIQLVELAAAKEQLRINELRLADLQRQNRQLSADRDDSNQRAKELEEALDRSKLENANQDSGLTSTKALVKSLEQSNASLRDQIKALDAKLDAAEIRARDADVKIRAAEDKARKAEFDRRALQEAADAAVANVAELREQMRSLEQDRSDSQRKNENSDSSLARQVRELKEENARMRSAKDSELAELNAKLIMKERDLVDASSELSRLRENVRNQSVRNEEGEAERQAQVQVLQDQLSAAQDAQRRLQDQLANQQQQNNNLQKRAQSNENARQELEAQLQEAQDNLTRQVVVHQSTKAKANGLESQISVLEKALASAREERNNESLRAAAVEAAKENTIKSLRDQLNARERTKSEDALSNIQANNSSLSRDNQSLRNQIHEIEAQLNNARQQLQEDKSRAKSSLRNVESERNEARENTRALEQRNVELAEKARAQKDELDALRAETIIIRETMEQQRRELSSLRQEKNANASAMEQAVMTILSIEQQLQTNTELLNQQRASQVKEEKEQASTSVDTLNEDSTARSVGKYDASDREQIIAEQAANLNHISVALARNSNDTQVLANAVNSIRQQNEKLFAQLQLDQKSDSQIVDSIVRQLVDLTQKDQQAQQEIMELKQSLNNLNDNLQQTQDEYRKSQELLSSREAHIDFSAIEEENLIKATQALQEENQRLREKQRSQENRSRQQVRAVGQSFDKAMQAMNVLQSQNSRLRATLEDLNQINAVQMDRNQDVEQIFKENASLRSKLDITEKVSFTLLQQRSALIQQLSESGRSSGQIMTNSQSVRALISLDNLAQPQRNNNSDDLASQILRDENLELRSKLDLAQRVGDMLMDQRSVLIRAFNDSLEENMRLRQELNC